MEKATAPGEWRGLERLLCDMPLLDPRPGRHGPTSYREPAQSLLGHSELDARLSSNPRTPIYWDLWHQPITSELPVSENSPTFQKGNQGWEIGALDSVGYPHHSRVGTEGLPLVPEGWTHLEKRGLMGALPQVLHNTPNPGHPTKTQQSLTVGSSQGALGLLASQLYVW